MVILEKINAELNRLFDLFNKHYYNGEIKKPIIVAQTNGHNAGAMGWCTCNKVWKDNESNEYYYEITICSEYLYRDIDGICSTLLHEMVHLYCNERGIKNTSRGHTYHNKKFKEIAELHGLVIEYDKRIGWSISKLTDEAKAFAKANTDSSVFRLTRGRHKSPDKPEEPEEGEEPTGEEGGEEEPKPKQSMRKYVCPNCKTIIRATKDVNVKCADCDEFFEKEGKINVTQKAAGNPGISQGNELHTKGVLLC
ncbi:MAG: SprT family zinc-dependent metalloprotease [Clostridiaceae bacterium]|nr:SprT family zinc-dependent metalloprotease [Clostridiaceae bacterium]